MTYSDTTNTINASPADVKSLYFCISLKIQRAMGVVSEKTTNSIIDCVRSPKARFFLEVCMSNQKFIPVVFPGSPEIFKVQNPDGSLSYFSKDHIKLNVCNDDIFDYLDLLIDNFKHLTHLINYNPDNTYNFLFETFIGHFEKKIDLLCHFLRQEVGIIEVSTADDEIVGVSVKPIDKNE